ncbi:MAG: periplasmic heavy metal sensor, partial [Sphingomicrobium sp.]
MATRALIVAIAFLAAIAGVFAGRELFSAGHHHEESQLHGLLHNQLDLTPAQKARIEQMERRYAIRRKAIELELRTDNARLAAAIDAEHGYGPRVAQAVDQSHHAMGELQKVTLQHTFDMRSVLRPDQAAKFDAAVTKALTAGESES